MIRFVVPLIFLLSINFLACGPQESIENDAHIQLSGVYPHLAYYNDEGECGTGAVVPWAGRLWWISYGPHLPFGSSDKLYELDSAMTLTIRLESIGGTPANRLIHRESGQLFIGPYAIDSNRNVRPIPYEQMPGRHTGTVRHLSDPENKVYYATMEEGFYEVDVHTLEVNMLYEDGNVSSQKKDDTDMNPPGALLKGAHGKGAYSGQGVMVYSNNGETGEEAKTRFDIEAGSLSEWDGVDWKLVRRNQFVEVTGPGGILGNEDADNDPIWATGWDHKSLIMALRDQGSWQYFRFPKASHSYDGAHGWNTEWPRIRDVGEEGNPNYLMTMHGMFWDFPGDFSKSNTQGIRPKSAYLKVIGDFSRWGDRLVFGCDDSAHREFLNKRSAKGGIEGPGQSNSNLWFTDLDLPGQLGPATANGTLWLDERVNANQPSEPMLFQGWEHKTIWIQNKGNETVTFTLETGNDGIEWSALTSYEVAADGAFSEVLEGKTGKEWVRVKTNKGTFATVHLSFTDKDKRAVHEIGSFKGVKPIQEEVYNGGLLYGLGDNRRKLGLAGQAFEGKQISYLEYYELDEKMNLEKVEDKEQYGFIKENFAIPEQVFQVDKGSVLIVDDADRRWRLPLGDEAFTEPSLDGRLRICREVATERDLFNCHGTFYELPAENADGYAKIRPISSHNLRIHDYASYRGLLVMTGVDPEAASQNPHVISSKDGKLGVWAGVIDDLWKLGKPVGKGGPWMEEEVKAGIPSDPYLFGFYDKKKLELSHDSGQEVQFTIEIEPIGHGPWMEYQRVTVKPGETFSHEFPEGIQGRWIRFTSDRACRASAWLTYE